MFQLWGRRAALAAGLTAAFGLMLAMAGADPALAKPKPGAKAPPAVVKAKPKRDDRDDDLEGVPRHVIFKDDEGWVLVEDEYLKVGPSVRIRVITLGAPMVGAPRGLILENSVEINCKTLSSRTLDQAVLSTDLKSRTFSVKKEEWSPITPGQPLLPVAQAFCNGRALSAGHVPIAPLDTLYALAFDAPYPRQLIDVGEDNVLLLDVRATGKGQRPQATLQTILRRPDDGAVFMTLTAEFNCEKQTYRVHRLIMRRGDLSVIGTSGAEANWEPVDSVTIRLAATAACLGTYPSQARPVDNTLGEIHDALLQGPWR